jgi:site-specific DNA recombinase
MTRVCLYTRISTDEENQPTSLASQHERLEVFCKVQEDWRIVARHDDRSTSTKLDRPGLQAALDLARQGRIDQLLVYRIDRLSRKVRQLAQLAEELDACGVVLRSATEPFDTGSPVGRMMLQMLGVFAEFEHATIVDRITAGIERRAKEGRWYSGRPPFGYSLCDGQLVPDLITAPIVRRIYRLYTEDRLGTIAIAQQLRAEQSPAPSAGWGHPAVHRVLTNPTYLGRLRWRGEDFASGHEPLIDPDTFRQAQTILSERGEDASRRRGNRSDFLLSGVIRCGHCGRAYIGMSAHGKGGTYHYYACTARQKYGPKACRGERIRARSWRLPSFTSSPASTATAHSSTTPSPPLNNRRNASDPRSTNAAARSPRRLPTSNVRPSATSRPSSKAASPPSAASSASPACKPASKTSTPNKPSSPTTTPTTHTRPQRPT